ncbi:MAG TPA: hypothetical protein VEY10_16085 [Flavisolibacter sp.]|jgi:glycosyltransferase involved in cell wall biosynthesis|nr:hypothetical protein [Flavisolibacter sp.]
MNKKTILLVGPLPPPSGGVSIHIQRLSNVLKTDFEVDFVDEAKSVKKEFFNLRSLRLFRYLKKVRKADLIHIHSGTSFLRIFHIITGRLLGKKIIVTLHYYPIRKIKIFKFIDEVFYKLANKIIVVNSNILQNVSVPLDKCVIRNAFLPPVMEKEPQLPPNIMEWIRNEKKLRKIIICANAWRLDMFNNHDLYGLDMCIEIARRLLEDKLEVSFVFNVATIDNFSNVYTRYQSLIEGLHLQHNFLLISQDLSFVRLIQEADIVLRPTNWDGDSLTVREALMLGKPTLASDIVERPAGTSLFKTRDIVDLEIKLKQMLNLVSTTDFSKVDGDNNAFADFYIDLTGKILGKNGTKSDYTAKLYQGTFW